MTHHALKLVLMPGNAYRDPTFRTALDDTLDRIASLIETYQINGVEPFAYRTEKDPKIADFRNRWGRLFAYLCTNSDKNDACRPIR